MRILPVVILVLALTAPCASAKVVPIPGLGATLTVPDEWTVLPRAAAALVLAAPGESTALGVVVSPNLHQTQITDDYVDQMKEGYTEKAKKDGIAIKVIDSGIRKLNGVPAGYVETEQAFSDNRTIYSQAYNVAANGKFIILTLDTRDLYQEPGLQKIAESLHFDKTPQLPDPNLFLVHRLGEVAGVILLISLAAWGARLYLQRRDRE